MELNSDERRLLKILLENHLEEIKDNEEFLNQQASVFAAEVKYEDFVKKLLDKLA